MHIAISININNIFNRRTHWLRINFNYTRNGLTTFTTNIYTNNIKLLKTITPACFIFRFLQYSISIKCFTIKERIFNGPTPFTFQYSYDDPQSHPLWLSPEVETISLIEIWAPDLYHTAQDGACHLLVVEPSSIRSLVADYPIYLIFKTFTLDFISYLRCSLNNSKGFPAIHGI